MSKEMTQLMTFSSLSDLEQSVAHSKSAIPASEFLARFVDFIKQYRLDDIEKIVAEGRLDNYFPEFPASDVAAKKWAEVESLTPTPMTEDRFDRFLKGE